MGSAGRRLADLTEELAKRAAQQSFVAALGQAALSGTPLDLLVAEMTAKAKRMNAKTIEVNSSHAAYISHPKETAKLIEEAANSAPSNH